MLTAISMPKLGMTMEEGTVVRWLVAAGSAVEKGEVLLIIESEKNEVEIEASQPGFFRHRYVAEAETVHCGALLGALSDAADEAFDADAFRAREDVPDGRRGEALTVKSAPAASQENTSDAPASKSVAPAARALAGKLGLDVQQVHGTGPKGRVTREDVQRHAASREALVPVGAGVSLEVLKAGAGEPVVLLPGLGMDASVFSRQIPFLSERFCVHGVNPRGVGLSDAPRTDAYEVAQTAADAAASFEGAAHVIGASLGAAAAMELALSAPARVKTLTLITPFITQTPRLVAVSEGWRRVAAESSPEALAASLLPWFFSSGFLAAEGARERTLRGLAQAVARVSAQTVHRMAAGLSSWSGTRAKQLAAITAPTLVIVAGEDLITPDSEEVAHSIPTAVLLRVERAGHAVMVEAPDAVNEALAAHLL